MPTYIKGRNFLEGFNEEGIITGGGILISACAIGSNCNVAVDERVAIKSAKPYNNNNNNND